MTILACMHELSRSGQSLSTTAVVALFAYAQPFGHAADQLLETAALLAFLLLPVALQQLGSPLFELVDRDHPARGIVGLLTFGEHAAAVGCGVEPSVACAAAPPKGTNSRLGAPPP